MPATAPRPLTKKQSLILCAIVRHIADHGYPPSIRDLCGEFDISSPNGMKCHLNALRKKGVLSWTEKTKTRGGKTKSPPEARSFVVAGLGDRIKDAAKLHLRELAHGRESHRTNLGGCRGCQQEERRGEKALQP